MEDYDDTTTRRHQLAPTESENAQQQSPKAKNRLNRPRQVIQLLTTNPSAMPILLFVLPPLRNLLLIMKPTNKKNTNRDVLTLECGIPVSTMHIRSHPNIPSQKTYQKYPFLISCNFIRFADIW